MNIPKPLFELQNDETALIADWYAVAYDLEHVVTATKSLVNLLAQPKHDSTLVRSLWTSALISYARCFGSGRRARLEPYIFANLQGDPLDTHQYYIDTRNKHIAHPVNAFEEVRVGLVLDKAGTSLCIGHLAPFRICDDTEGIEQLGILASIAHQYVIRIVQPLENLTLDSVKGNPTLLGSLKPLRIQPQGGAEAARTPRVKSS